MRCLTILLALLAVPLLGCRNATPAPEVYPATGVVLSVDGSPATGGMVEFRQTEAPFVVATGPIGQDGTFALGSIFEERRLKGVPAGTYRVTVLPDFSGSAQSQHLAQPVVMPEPLSVSSSEQNAFEIDLRKTKR